MANQLEEVEPYHEDPCRKCRSHGQLRTHMVDVLAGSCLRVVCGDCGIKFLMHCADHPEHGYKKQFREVK